jgi:hypothetical protein
MLRQILLFITLLSLSLATACDPEPTATADTSLCGESDASAGDPLAETDTGPASADLTGRWAMAQVLTATVSIAGAQASENRVETLLVVDMDSAGPAFAMTEEVCSIALKNIAGVCGEGSLVTTQIPDAYIQSIAPLERSGTVSDSDGTLTLAVPRIYQLKGVILEEPSSTPLPADPAHPAYWDQDGDGKPGMTLRFVQPGMLIGELYVGQRDWTELDGTIVGGGRVEGHINWGSEQVTLGSNPETLLESSPKSAPSTDPEKSYFIMVRIDDSADCASVTADMTNLFPGL